jgi:ABC-type phosphate/phosphonate transport system substrate-binding protein
MPYLETSGHRRALFSAMAARSRLVCILGMLAVGVPICQAAPQSIRIGRLIGRTHPEQSAGERALAKYLTAKVPGYAFEFVWFPETAGLIDAAENRRIDFAEVNPSLFVQLEVTSGATPIATAVFQLPHGLQLQTLGGVVFCGEQARNIQRLEDLRGKRVAATTPTALGGALAVLRELKEIGIRPDKDLKEFRYLGSQQSVIAAVLSGEVDCGFAPSNSFATALENGDLDKNRVRVLPPPHAHQIGRAHV